MSPGLGEMPVRPGVIMLHDWPPRNSNLPVMACTQYRRIRSVALLLVTNWLVGPAPRKSASRYPRTFQSPALLVAPRVTREFCAERRVSGRLPAAVLLKGIVPNDVPIPVPVSTERVTDVASMKPPIVMSASPMCSANGDVGGGTGVFVTTWGVEAGAGAGADAGVVGSVAGAGDSVTGFCAGVDAGAGLALAVPGKASCAHAADASEAVNKKESRRGEPIRRK